jgi:hypothetical protein
MNNMSDPLTVRLRRGFGGLVPPVCDEAANELERLQREVTELEDEARAANVRCDKVAAEWAALRSVVVDAFKALQAKAPSTALELLREVVEPKALECTERVMGSPGMGNYEEYSARPTEPEGDVPGGYSQEYAHGLRQALCRIIATEGQVAWFEVTRIAGDALLGHSWKPRSPHEWQGISINNDRCRICGEPWLDVSHTNR